MSWGVTQKGKLEARKVGLPREVKEEAFWKSMSQSITRVCDFLYLNIRWKQKCPVISFDVDYFVHLVREKSSLSVLDERG